MLELDSTNLQVWRRFFLSHFCFLYSVTHSQELQLASTTSTNPNSALVTQTQVSFKDLNFEDQGSHVKDQESEDRRRIC